MRLSPGAQLGPYEVVRPLGSGGMGEVYLARDTRLDRSVAVKVLPQHLSSSAELRQRFEREARAASSLNHPHICAIYDIGNQDGTDYIVMEHLEGETLAQRLAKGPIRTAEAIRIGMQIADALDKAHQGGLIHRDLKPGNVMLTKSGAKLLDFGLAKSATPSGESSPMTAAATMTSPLTAQGMIVGTFQYMSPEQLEGGDVTARSDIFAFGVVLYEMLAGRKAFEGKTQASLVAAILKETPQPLSALQPLTPPGLARLVETCLEKDPDERRQSMHDVLLELRWLADGSSQTGVPAPALPAKRPRERLAWIVAAIAVAAAGGLAILAAFGPARPAGASTCEAEQRPSPPTERRSCSSRATTRERRPCGFDRWTLPTAGSWKVRPAPPSPSGLPTAVPLRFLPTENW
ncbi:MAG TPA: serine/threonine-protein kinase [Candidatus Polarisedimenticolia bacterium]|nr:serine/threonine-protein kinase [Candidatus Polarisedimenticolia bacterium]